MAPLLSVIIPTLNVDRELRRCVDSVRMLCEDTACCEIVLVVPARAIDEARLLFPSEIVVQEKFSGIYGAMNDGVRKSTGRYLYFLGKDDVVLPAMLDVIEILREKSPGAVFCDVYWGDLGVYSGRPSKLRIVAKNMCHQGIIYSRYALSKYGPYVRRMKVQADQFVNTKMLWDPKFSNSIVYLKKPLAWYSSQGYSSVVRDLFFWKLQPLILDKYVGKWAAFVLRLYRVLYRR